MASFVVTRSGHKVSELDEYTCMNKAVRILELTLQVAGYVYPYLCHLSFQAAAIWKVYAELKQYYILLPWNRGEKPPTGLD
jgi:hypothetical protein